MRGIEPAGLIKSQEELQAQLEAENEAKFVQQGAGEIVKAATQPTQDAGAEQ